MSTSLARLTGRADGAAGMVIDSWAAHRHGRPSGSNPDWGADVGTGRDGDMIYQRTELEGLTDEQRDRYFDALSLSLDYILGCNPAGYFFVTGLGSRSPREPLHLDSLAFIKAQGHAADARYTGLRSGEQHARILVLFADSSGLLPLFQQSATVAAPD